MATRVPPPAIARTFTLFRPQVYNARWNLGRPFHSSVPCKDVYQDANLATFKKVTRAKDRLVLVDFYADWCRPCHQLSPVLEKLCSDPSLRSGTNNLPLDLIKVDVDSVDGDALAQQFKVKSLPTVFAFQDGKPVSQFRGAIPEPAVQKFIESL